MILDSSSSTTGRFLKSQHHFLKALERLELQMEDFRRKHPENQEGSTSKHEHPGTKR